MSNYMGFSFEDLLYVQFFLLIFVEFLLTIIYGLLRMVSRQEKEFKKKPTC